MKKSISHIQLIILLAVLSAIAPMAVDTYIPSIPTMAREFNVWIEQIELTLTVFLIGFAVGQIFGGIISDRIGRKKSSLIGLFGFALFSFVMIFSTTSFELLIFRFIEAFFGGLIVVNASAIVRDKFTTQEAAKIFSLIGTIRSIAPLIAPAIGAFIIYFYSWKAIFIFLMIYSLVVAFWVYKDLKETYVYSNQSILQSYKIVFLNKSAMQIMVVLALGFSGMFTIIAKSPFIYIEYFGVTSNWFPLYFGFSIITLMVMISVNIRLLKSYEPIFLIRFAVLLQIVIACLFVFISEYIGLYFTLILIASYVSLNGFIYGNCTALAMESFSKNAGVASAVIGVVQFGLGAIISSIAIVFHSNTLFPIALSLFFIPMFSYLILLVYKK